MKIGDLWVKLGLKKDEYSRGMKDAKKEASSFVDVVKAIGSKGKVAFAAVAAAVVGVVAAVKNLAKENQVLGDTVARFGAGMSAMFDTLKTSIASLDFSNLISRLTEANRLARDLYDAQDAMGEIGTAYNLSLAQQLKHINELKVRLRDLNLSDDERIAAGQELLRIYEALEKNPTRGMERVKDTSLDYYMSQLGVNMDNRTDAQLAAMRRKFVSFFEWLGTKEGEVYLSAAETVNKAGGANGYLGRTMLANAEKEGRAEFARLAIAYSARMGDEDRAKMEQAVVGYYQQEAKYSAETLRIQNQINSIKAKDNSHSGAGTTINKRLQEAQRIAERAEKSGKSQLQVLNETYALEKALLESFGMDTTSLTQEYTKNIGNLFDVPLKKMEEMDELIGDLDFELDEDPVREFVDSFERDVERMQELLYDFQDAVMHGFVDATQEMFDQFAGLEEVNPGRIVQALLTPLADMAIKEGEILIATGVGVEAVKTALESLNGPAAIAAGAALVMLGAAAKSGLAALAKSGGGTTSATTYSGGSGSVGVEDLKTEMTVYVKGTIRGSDIVLSGQKTVDNWRR